MLGGEPVRRGPERPSDLLAGDDRVVGVEETAVVADGETLVLAPEDRRANLADQERSEHPMPVRLRRDRDERVRGLVPDVPKAQEQSPHSSRFAGPDVLPGSGRAAELFVDRGDPERPLCRGVFRLDESVHAVDRCPCAGQREGHVGARAGGRLHRACVPGPGEDGRRLAELGRPQIGMVAHYVRAVDVSIAAAVIALFDLLAVLCQILRVETFGAAVGLGAFLSVDGVIDNGMRLAVAQFHRSVGSRRTRLSSAQNGGVVL